MSKQEFIERLSASLNGRISSVQLEDTINYYRNYIDSEVSSGKSETEVMGALGDPRLIARTIIETTQPAGDNSSVHRYGSNYRNNDYQNNAQDDYSYQDNFKRKNKHFRVPGWLFFVLVILVVVLLLCVVFSVLSFLAPVIIVIAAVLFLVKLFRDWLN